MANGQTWHIGGIGQARDWARAIAALMNLHTSPDIDGAKLVFAQDEPDEVEALSLLPEAPTRPDDRPEGWQFRDLSGLRIWTHGSQPDVVCRVPEWNLSVLRRVKLWASVEPIYERAERAGGLRVHGALLNRGGHGVILAGPGEIGKTTCCRRLPPDWTVLSDDETLIVKCDDRTYEAHPFPNWSRCAEQREAGRWDVQRHVPVAAVLFLEQAETSRLVPLTPGLALLLLHEVSAGQLGSRSCLGLDRTGRQAVRRRLFDNAQALAKAVPCFTLRIARRGPFWEHIDDALVSLTGSPTRS